MIQCVYNVHADAGADAGADPDADAEATNKTNASANGEYVERVSSRNGNSDQETNKCQAKIA